MSAKRSSFFYSCDRDLPSNYCMPGQDKNIQRKEFLVSWIIQTKLTSTYACKNPETQARIHTFKTRNFNTAV